VVTETSDHGWGPPGQLDDKKHGFGLEKSGLGLEDHWPWHRRLGFYSVIQKIEPPLQFFEL